MTPDFTTEPFVEDGLSAILRGLRAASCELSATDVADACWLFARTARPVAAADAPQEQTLPEPEVEEAFVPPPPPSLPPPLPPVALPPIGAMRPAVVSRRASSVAISSPGGDSERSGARVQIPSFTAITDRRAFVGGLRPLLARRRSRDRLELDVEATVQRRIEEGGLSLAFAPGFDRWLEVSIVLDRSVSMAVWESTVRDLRRVFETLGTFRRIQVWALDTDHPEPTLRFAPRFGPSKGANGTPSRGPRAVVGPSGASLVLIVSDCVSTAWYHPTLTKWVNEWAAVARVGLLNVLPFRMWPRTAIGDFRVGTLRSAGGGFAARAHWQAEWPLDRHAPDSQRPVPITVLAQPDVAAFFKFVAGGGTAPVRGLMLKPAPQVNVAPLSANVSPEKPDADALAEKPGAKAVRAFLNRASGHAQQLAKLLAAAPIINLDVLRLLAAEVPPDVSPGAFPSDEPAQYRPEHLAEVWLSGLLEEEEPETAIAPATYCLAADVREALFQALPRPQAIRALEVAIEYAVSKCDWGHELWAFLREPSSDGPKLRRGTPPAHIAAHVLKQLGGQYARFADEESGPEAGSADFEMPSWVLAPVEHRPDQTTLTTIYDLHRTVRKWIDDCAAVQKNEHYKKNHPFVDLLFAFGLGILRDVPSAEKLLDEAGKSLIQPNAVLLNIKYGASYINARADIVNNFLYKLFEYRIGQVLNSRPAIGKLPENIIEEMSDLEEKAISDGVNGPFKMSEYMIYQLYSQLRILDPDSIQVNPYRRYLKGHNLLEEKLEKLDAIKDPSKLADRIRKLHREGVPGAVQKDVQFRVLHAGLPLAPRVSEAFTVELLTLVPAALGGNGGANESPDLSKKQGELLRQGLFLAARFNRGDVVKMLLDESTALVRTKPQEVKFRLINLVAGQGIRSLKKFGFLNETDQFLTKLNSEAFGGASLADLKKKYQSKPELWAGVLQTLLTLAGGWLYFGQPDRAEPMLDEARNELLGANAVSLQPKDYTELARAYVTALGQGPSESGLARMIELFKKMSPAKITNTWTTAYFYSRFHLNLIEDTVLAIYHMFH